MSDIATNGDTIIKEGPVLFAGKDMNLKISSSGLTICSNISENGKETKGLQLSWSDVISAQASAKSKGANVNKCFTLNYMQLQSDKKLRVKKVDISSTVESSDTWITTIQEQCASVTERAKHALEIAEQQDFSTYDGIVVVGGDGSYHEVLNGLTRQMQKASGVDYDDFNSTLKPLNKPLAVIPAGTGNGVSGWMNGTIDVETAALRVVRGEQHTHSVYAVHSNGKLFAICGLLVGLGFFSDMIKRTEELRWMKRARYAYGLLSSMLGKKREWQCSLEYQLAPDSAVEESSSGANDEAGLTEFPRDSFWTLHEGKTTTYCGVFALVADMIKGEGKTRCDIDAGCTSLFIDQGCSVFSLLKFMLNLMLGKNIEPLPANLEMMKRVQAVRVKVLRDPAKPDGNLTRAEARSQELEHYINVDGESRQLEVPEIELRVIKSFVPFYGIQLFEV